MSDSQFNWVGLNHYFNWDPPMWNKVSAAIYIVSQNTWTIKKKYIQLGLVNEGDVKQGW